MAVDALSNLEGAVENLVRRLGWKDFELLCDLIFTRAGWQRVGALGRTQKTVDLELLSPVTGRRAWVQVKSQATLEIFEQYSAEFRLMAQFDEMFFVVHSPSDDLKEIDSGPTIHVLTGPRLAKLVVSAGLVNWLIQKAK